MKKKTDFPRFSRYATTLRSDSAIFSRAHCLTKGQTLIAFEVVLPEEFPVDSWAWRPEESHEDDWADFAVGRADRQTDFRRQKHGKSSTDLNGKAPETDTQICVKRT